MLFSFNILSFCLMCKSPILFVRVYLILTDYGENRVIFEWILMKFCVGLKMQEDEDLLREYISRLAQRKKLFW